MPGFAKPIADWDTSDRLAPLFLMQGAECAKNSMPHPHGSPTALLLRSARENDAPEALRLLALGADPLALDDDSGFSVLMLAAAAGCEPLVEALIELKAPVETRHFLSPLDVAVREGRVGCARLLLPLSNPDRNVFREGSALHLAATKGNIECVMLLASKTRAKKLDALGNTPLMNSAGAPSPEAFDALLPISPLGPKNVSGSTALSLLSYQALSFRPAAHADRWRVVFERAWLKAKPAEQKAALAALFSQSRWRQIDFVAPFASAEQLQAMIKWIGKDTRAVDKAPPALAPKLLSMMDRAHAMAQARLLSEAVATASARPDSGSEPSVVARSAKRRL